MVLQLYCCCCDCVSGPDGCSSYLCCCKVGSGHTGFEKGGGDLATCAQSLLRRCSLTLLLHSCEYEAALRGGPLGSSAAMPVTSFLCSGTSTPCLQFLKGSPSCRNTEQECNCCGARPPSQPKPPLSLAVWGALITAAAISQYGAMLQLQSAGCNTECLCVEPGALLPPSGVPSIQSLTLPLLQAAASCTAAAVLPMLVVQLQLRVCSVTGCVCLGQRARKHGAARIGGGARRPVQHS